MRRPTGSNWSSGKSSACVDRTLTHSARTMAEVAGPSANSSASRIARSRSIRRRIWRNRLSSFGWPGSTRRASSISIRASSGLPSCSSVPARRRRNIPAGPLTSPQGRKTPQTGSATGRCATRRPRTGRASGADPAARPDSAPDPDPLHRRGAPGYPNRGPRRRRNKGRWTPGRQRSTRCRSTMSSRRAGYPAVAGLPGSARRQSNSVGFGHRIKVGVNSSHDQILGEGLTAMTKRSVNTSAASVDQSFGTTTVAWWNSLPVRTTS